MEQEGQELHCRSCHLVRRRQDFSKTQLKHGPTGRCKHCAATGARQRRHTHHSHAAKWHRVLAHQRDEMLAVPECYNARRDEMLQCWRLAEAIHKPARLDLDAGSRAKGFPQGADYIAFPRPIETADTTRLYKGRSKRPCVNMARYDYCSYGPYCYFLHPAPQRARTCINFLSAKGCQYGAQCHFLHGAQSFTMSRDTHVNDRARLPRPDPGTRRGDTLEAHFDGYEEVLAGAGTSLNIYWTLPDTVRYNDDSIPNTV
jgi:hypothetical protein